MHDTEGAKEPHKNLFKCVFFLSTITPKMTRCYMTYLKCFLLKSAKLGAITNPQAPPLWTTSTTPTCWKNKKEVLKSHFQKMLPYSLLCQTLFLPLKDCGNPGVSDSEYLPVSDSVRIYRPLCVLKRPMGVTDSTDTCSMTSNELLINQIT